MNNCYIPDGKQITFDDGAIIREPQGIELENALVAVGRTFGVFDANGAFVPGSGIDGRPLPGKKAYKSSQYYDELAIFCGRDRFFHFGHFLVEGLERVWPLLGKKYKNAKLVFVTSRKSMPKYAIDFLSMIGVSPERVILLNKSARFRRLYVPESASRIGLYTSSVQNNVYQTIAKNAPSKTFGDKIYLSRCGMGNRSIFGEEQIQRIFEKNGFTVVYPERLSISEQVAVAAGAKCIAGVAGSALHLSVFMKSGGRVIQLNRARDGDNSIVQYVLCRGAGVDMTLIAASMDTDKKVGHGADRPHIIGVTHELKCFFDDNKFKYSASDIAHNAAAFEQYDLAVREYHNAHGLGYKTKKHIIKFIACFVPGYKNRRVVRHYLERKFGVENH